MINPITPKEASVSKLQNLPEQVIETWNTIIATNLRGNVAIVKQNLIVSALCGAMECTRNMVFNSGWLEIESLYRKAGWKVVYDKPGYNEDYEAYFTFTFDKL